MHRRAYVDVLKAGVEALLNALEARDEATWQHSRRVSRYAVAIGRKLRLDAVAVAEVGLGALLHDVGKLGVPEAILQKRSALSRTEYHLVCRHMTAGERILRPLLKSHPRVLRIVRSHHERVDGSGLPDGLSGRAIPLGARIVAVADAFDAMTADRPYRGALDCGAALEELERCSGTQFDQWCVAGCGQAFLCDAPQPWETRSQAITQFPTSGYAFQQNC